MDFASKQYLNSHPLCAKCLENGKYRKATSVYSIIPPHKPEYTREVNDYCTNNWQSLCDDCYQNAMSC